MLAVGGGERAPQHLALARHRCAAPAARRCAAPPGRRPPRPPRRCGRSTRNRSRPARRPAGPGPRVSGTMAATIAPTVASSSSAGSTTATRRPALAATSSATVHGGSCQVRRANQCSITGSMGSPRSVRGGAAPSPIGDRRLRPAHAPCVPVAVYPVWPRPCPPYGGSRPPRAPGTPGPRPRRPARWRPACPPAGR